MAVVQEESTWEAERRGYIRCRTIGHSWHDYDSNWTPSWGVPLTVRCERCGMERRDSVSSVTGELMNRHYIRPGNYQLRRGEYRPTKNNFRQMLLALREAEATRSTRRRVKTA